MAGSFNKIAVDVAGLLDISSDVLVALRLVGSLSTHPIEKKLFCIH